MSTTIEPEDVRKGDRITVVFKEDAYGITETSTFVVVKVDVDHLYYKDDRFAYYACGNSIVDHIELVDRPKPVIKVGDRVRHTTEYGTVTEFDVHRISEYNYAYPRDLLLPGRRVESLELVTEQ